LPALAFWFLPGAIGAPIIARAIVAARNRAQAGPSSQRHRTASHLQ
jgi:hypothetical protein